MNRSILALFAILAALAGCARHKPAVDGTHPYAAEQQAARNRVEARGRYDVNHHPDDTMSVNSMGSD